MKTYSSAIPMGTFRGWWNRGNHADRQAISAEIAYLEKGGAVVTLREVSEGACFPLGTISVTLAAIKALEGEGETAWSFLLRHMRGEWGAYGRMDQVTVSGADLRNGPLSAREPAKQNKIALLLNSGRVVSEYRMTHGQQIWVITHLGAGGYTSILVPRDC